MTSCTENRQISAVSRRNTAKVDAVFRRHGPGCMRVAMRVTQDHHHAQDAVQDAFLAYYRDSARFDANRGNIGSWLAMLTHRRAVDIVRREQARPDPPRYPNLCPPTTTP